MKGFFIDSTSFNIAINMLFVKGSYESKEQVSLHVSLHGGNILKSVCSRRYGRFKNNEEPRSTIQQRHTHTSDCYLL